MKTKCRRIGNIISDQFRGLIWSGRPVIVMRFDRNKYFAGWNGYFKSKKYRIDPSRIDGSVKAGLIPIIRIFEPCEINPLNVLRHECHHIRLGYIRDINSDIAYEAVDIFMRDPVSADYAGPGGNIVSEAIVRLAEMRCLGQPMPPMSRGLSRVVRSVTRPAPILVAAHVAVLALLMLALLSAASVAVAAPRVELQSPTGAENWRWYSCVKEGGEWITHEAQDGPDAAAWRSLIAARGMAYFPEVSPPCGVAAAICEGRPAGERIIEAWKVGDRSRWAAPTPAEHEFAGRWVLTC